jgi:hypothetical protein
MELQSVKERLDRMEETDLLNSRPRDDMVDVEPAKLEIKAVEHVEGAGEPVDPDPVVPTVGAN